MAPLKFSKRELTLYVGTYTSGKSEGIYTYRMDQSTGELRLAASIKADNPSFLAIDPSRRFLYAVNENPKGTASAYGIAREDGALSFVNQQSSAGADPCHVTVARNRKSLFVASHAGRIFGVPEAQGKALIDELIAHATQRQFVYTHRWRPNELVMWDNRCTMHRGTDYDDLRWVRDMARVTISDVANSCEQEGLKLPEAVAAA